MHLLVWSFIAWWQITNIETFQLFFPALTPLLCQSSCYIEMNDGISFTHSPVLSLWMWPWDRAHRGCEQDPGVGRITPADPFTAPSKQLFPSRCFKVKKREFVFCVRVHPVLIPLCLISLSKNSVSSSCRQQLITPHSLSEPSHQLEKQFFCHCGFNWSNPSTWQKRFPALN